MTIEDTDEFGLLPLRNRVPMFYGAANISAAADIVHAMTPHELVKAANITLEHRVRITRIGGGG